MIEGVELVAHNTLVFAEVEKDSLGDNSALKSELSFAVVQLYASILRYLSTARAYYSQRTMKRFFKSVFDDAGSASALLDQIKQSAKEAHTIADRVEHKGLQLKSTFIQRQCFDRNQTPNAILRSWISQIIQQSDIAIPIAEEVLLPRDQKARQPVEDLWKLLSRLSKSLDGLTLVLDGLDELSRATEALQYNKSSVRAQFLQDLKDSTQNTPAHVLVVSRDLLDIRQELTPNVIPHGMEFREYGITPKDMSSDISAYSEKIYTDAVGRGLKMPRAKFMRAFKTRFLRWTWSESRKKCPKELTPYTRRNL
ncbi:hypothetical protein HDK77DRAFT_428427 [Phyllosticta capitalensis]